MNANTSLQLTTKANDPDGDKLVYAYSVSGGRITGEGADVSWDVSGLGPGPLTATVEVDDGRGGITSATTRITIVLCSDCMIVDNFPTISVSCPEEVEPNGQVTFSARVSQGTPLISETYKWTVSAGAITSGQGTSSIIVSTAGLAGQTVTATVDVGGFDPSYNHTASCTTPVKPALPSIEHFDEYGNIRFDDEKARLDNFAIQLQNEPGFIGYIVGYGSCDREGIIRANRAKTYIVNIRGLDASRVVTVDGGCLPELRVQLWLPPPGVKVSGDAVGVISPCPACKKNQGAKRHSRRRA